MAAFPAPASGVARANELVLRAAVSAYLGRYRGETRLHTESDLRVFLRWCTDHELDPLAAVRVDIERYVRWLQDVRRDQPPTVPAESPTLGLGHLQFEALITTARLSPNLNDFALVAFLGLLGLRIFEACGASIADLSEEPGHRVLRVRGKGGKVVLACCHRRWPERSTAPSTAAPRGRSCATLSAPAWTATPPPDGSSSWPPLPGSACRGCTLTCCAIRSWRPCSTPASICATCRSRRAMPTRERRCATTGPARTSTAIRTTSWRRTWLPERS